MKHVNILSFVDNIPGHFVSKVVGFLVDPSHVQNVAVVDLVSHLFLIWGNSDLQEGTSCQIDMLSQVVLGEDLCSFENLEPSRL